LRGLEEVIKNLKKLDEKMQTKIAMGGVRNVAVQIKNEAKLHVPVDSGALRKSLGVAKAKKKDTPDGHSIYYVVPKHIKYGSMVEFGTSKTPAQPYLRKAIDVLGDSVMDGFRAYITKRIEKEQGK